MANDPRSRTDPATVVAVVAGVLVLCAIVAVASTARDPAPFVGGAPPPDVRSSADLSVPVSLLFLAVPLGLLVVVVARVMARPAAPADERDGRVSGFEVNLPVWLRRVIVVLVALSALLAIVMMFQLLRRLMPPAGGGGGTTGDGEATVGDGRVGEAAQEVHVPHPTVEQVFSSPAMRWALIVAGLLLVGITVLAIVRARSDVVDDDPLLVPNPNGGAWPEPVDDPFAIDRGQLLAGDPRRGIERCFAAAAHILVASGFAPEWSETSAEHVARVAPELPGAAGAALDQLSALFHEAKFSRHPIHERQRADAVAALVILRDQLRPWATPPPERGPAFVGADPLVMDRDPWTRQVPEPGDDPS